VSTKKVILIVVVVVIIILGLAGTIAGYVFNKGGFTFFENNKKKEKVEKYYLSLDSIYCNIKDSKKVLSLKVTIELIDEDSKTELENKQFLIKDDINKIIRNKTEEELQGSEGLTNLQKEIKNSLVKIFDDESITNVYFDEMIIQ